MIKKGKYRHFKGGEYEVLGIAKHSETLKEMVLYRHLDELGSLWVRPKEMFLGEKELSNGKRVKRFELIKEYEE